jgi:hypothetical protein
LRAKLRTSGVDGMVETLPDGSYRLLAIVHRPAIPLDNDLALDGYIRMGKEQITI